MKPHIYWVLIQKELTEQMRSGRFIILLAVFLFFGIASPLTAKFLPAILPSIIKGQNITIQIPEGTWIDAMGQFVKNISQIGVFIIILLSMGTVAREKENGTASFLLVKPVSRNLFILSKFTSQLIVLLVSMLVGFFTAVLYINIFFGSFPMTPFAQIALILLFYLIVMQCITIFFSVLIKTQIPAGILAFVTTLLLSAVSILGKPGMYSPSHLLDESQSILTNSIMNWQPFAGSLLIIICCIGGSLRIFRNWES
jgi:ABC-2 type transport system permease protein